MDSKRWRIYFGRVALAVAGPVVFFAGLEGVLFLTGKFDPVRVLERVEYEGREYWATVPEFGDFALRRDPAPRPQPVWVPVKKEAGTLRVVLVGESAAAGFPGEEFGQARLLDALWRERFPDRPIEVVNLTMVGVSSHILRRFVGEAMAMGPDALVLYLGHNEVIGPYGPAARLAAFYPAGWMAQASLAARNTRTGRLLEWTVQRVGALAGRRTEKWFGLDSFQGARVAADDVVLEEMAAQTKKNVRAMAEMAVEAGCKVLVCVPAVNLTDWPPVASAEGDEKISAKAAYAKARELQAAGRKEEAWEFYRRACDLDEMRFRADSRVREVQREVVAEMATRDVVLVDADIWLHEGNPGPLTDRDFFLEHVHLTFEGRVAVAALMVDGLAELLGVGTNDWADAQGWWEVFPRRVGAARQRVLFTKFNESLMLGQAEGLMDLAVFSQMQDLAERKKRLGEKSARLREESKTGFQVDQMKNLYLRAEQSNPKDPVTDLIAARNFVEMGFQDEALELIQSSFSKAPNLADTRLNLAILAVRENRLDDALEHLQEVRRVNPREDMVPRLYAEIYGRQGLFEEAIPHIKWDLEMNPDNPALWDNLGMAQEKSGRFEEAIESYRRGAEAGGGDAKNLSELARLLSLHGERTGERQQEAVRVARRAVEMDPEVVEFRANLAVALAWNGKKDEAEAEAASVAEMAAAQGNFEVVAKLRERMKKAEGRR